MAQLDDDLDRWDLATTDDAEGAAPNDAFSSAEECSAIVESENKHWPQEEGDTVALIHTP